MSGFGHFNRTARELEREIVKRGILLGLDWNDAATIRALAREALGCTPGCNIGLLHDPDFAKRGKGELFALSILMLQTMRESAEIGVHTSGGPAWKAFGRALYQESEGMKQNTAEGAAAGA